MKRVSGFLSVCLGLVLVWIVFRVVQHVRAAAEPTLHVDPLTRSILAQADRVETFRLADFHENAEHTEAELAVMDKGGLGTLDDHMIIRIGTPQNTAFGRRLLDALASAKDPAHSFRPSCFEPGVGFRAWRGRAHADVVICFYCSGVEIRSQDAAGRPGPMTHVDLGRARPALLTLSREAFPDDARLRALPTEAGSGS